MKSMLAEYVPSAHGRGALAPSAQYEPAVQGLQVGCPSVSWYVPAAHLTQLPIFTLGWTVPGLHWVCSELPVGAKEPTVVSVQSPTLLRLVKLEYEPSAHGSAALAPSGQYAPGVHGLQRSLPSTSW